MTSVLTFWLRIIFTLYDFHYLTILHSKQPKLHRVLAILSGVGLTLKTTQNSVDSIATLPFSFLPPSQVGSALKEFAPREQIPSFKSRPANSAGSHSNSQ